MKTDDDQSHEILGEKQCTIVRSHGQALEKSVLEFIKAHIKDNACIPRLAWAEPEPTAVGNDGMAGRRLDLVPLVAGCPNWPDDLPLVEARLFWEKTMLHVVATKDGGCAWARIEEIAENLADIGSGHTVMRLSYPVLATTDLERFGIQEPAHEIDAALLAVTYYQRGRLVGWRLALSGGEKDA